MNSYKIKIVYEISVPDEKISYENLYSHYLVVDGLMLSYYDLCNG